MVCWKNISHRNKLPTVGVTPPLTICMPSHKYQRRLMSTEFPTWAFVDYEKAFNSIQHKAVFRALQRHGVQEKYINILERDVQRTHSSDTNRDAKQENQHHERRPTGSHIVTGYVYISMEEIFKRVNIKTGVKVNGERLEEFEICRRHHLVCRE